MVSTISVGVGKLQLNSLNLKAETITRGCEVELRQGCQYQIKTYVSTYTHYNKCHEEYVEIENGDDIIIYSHNINSQIIHDLNKIGVGVIAINRDLSVSVYRDIPNSKKEEKEEEKSNIKEESDKLVEQLADHFSKWMRDELVRYECCDDENKHYLNQENTRERLAKEWKNISVESIEKSIRGLQERISIARLNYNSKQRDLIQLRLLVSKYIGDESDE